LPTDRLRSQHATGCECGRSSRTPVARTSKAASTASDGSLVQNRRRCSKTRAHWVLAVVSGRARHAPCIAKPRLYHARAHLRVVLARRRPQMPVSWRERELRDGQIAISLSQLTRPPDDLQMTPYLPKKLGVDPVSAKKIGVDPVTTRKIGV
jgi:hypothetical protein